MKDKNATLMQNLEDAGCDPTLVQQCAILSRENKSAALLRLLTVHRAKLLDSVHNEQNKLEYLDYLLYHLKTHKGDEKI